MIQKGSRVRHINPDIDSEKGIMIVREIKNGVAVCGYNDFDRIGQVFSYNVSDLKIAEN